MFVCCTCAVSALKLGIVPFWGSDIACAREPDDFLFVQKPDPKGSIGLSRIPQRRMLDFGVALMSEMADVGLGTLHKANKSSTSKTPTMFTTSGVILRACSSDLQHLEVQTQDRARCRWPFRKLHVR